MNGKLLRRPVLLLYDACHIPFFITENPSVSEWIIQNSSQNRSGCSIGNACIRQIPDCLSAKKRGVSADDKNISFRIILEFRQRLHDGMTCSELFFLMHKYDFFIFQAFSYKFFLKTCDYDTLFKSALSDNTDDLLSHRYAAHTVKHLGISRFHTGSLTGCQNDGCQLCHTTS